MYLTNTGRLVIGMAQFVQTHNGGKARSVIERSMHILEMQEAQEAMPSKSDYIFTFIEQEKNTLHVCHNHEWRCTCSFVHVFIQRLTVDFVGS